MLPRSSRILFMSLARRVHEFEIGDEGGVLGARGFVAIKLWRRLRCRSCGRLSG